MQIHPHAHPCPQHGIDLSGRVRTTLQHSAGAMFGGFRVTPSPLEMRRPQPFAVHVQCPGSGRGDAHTLVATGTFVP